nr:arylesterase [Kushneria phosphatilytica]
MVLGDSLSAARGIERNQGWVNLLRERLGDEQTVVNASISGDTTAGGLARLPEALELHQPDIVLLELGGNDGLRGLSLEQMKANLAQMIEKSQAAGARVGLLGIRIPPNYGPAYTKAFRAIYPELARQYEIPLVPFLLKDVALHDDLMQNDGIHPNAAAQPILLDNVWPLVQGLLQKPNPATARQADSQHEAS